MSHAVSIDGSKQYDCASAMQDYLFARKLKCLGVQVLRIVNKRDLVPISSSKLLMLLCGSIQPALSAVGHIWPHAAHPYCPMMRQQSSIRLQSTHFHDHFDSLLLQVCCLRP